MSTIQNEELESSLSKWLCQEIWDAIPVTGTRLKRIILQHTSKSRTLSCLKEGFNILNGEKVRVLVCPKYQETLLCLELAHNTAFIHKSQLDFNFTHCRHSANGGWDFCLHMMAPNNWSVSSTRRCIRVKISLT
jgi:hypothetical protein